LAYFYVSIFLYFYISAFLYFYTSVFLYPYISIFQCFFYFLFPDWPALNPRNWKPVDFGHGLPHDAEKKEYKVVIANYREALERLRLRAPPLPDDLTALWGDFVAEFPDWWLQQHKTRSSGNTGGKLFLDFLLKIIDDLGKHCLTNLANKPKPRGRDGDPQAFAKWVRSCLAKINGTGGKSVKL